MTPMGPSAAPSARLAPRRPAVQAVEIVERGRPGLLVVSLVEDPPGCGVPDCPALARATYRGPHGLEDRCGAHAAGRPLRELMLLYLEVVETEAVV